MRYLRDVSTLEFFPQQCTGCGRCVEVCPHAVFRMNDKRAVVVGRDRCIECGACVVNCGFGALKAERGVGCASALINSMIYGGEPSCDCTGSGAEAGGCC